MIRLPNPIPALALAAFVSHSPAAVPLDERAAKPDEWGYRPADGETVQLNPPTFTWIAPRSAVSYSVQWSRAEDFAEATTVNGIVWPTYTHRETIAPGTWFWRYRAVDERGETSSWSRTRRVIVPSSATTFPMPSREDQRARVPRSHPRLFLRPEDVPRLRELANHREKPAADAILKTADAYIEAGPTQEPAHPGSARDKEDPELVKHWWPNREQTERACNEAETIAFAYLLTGERKYGEAARRWVLHLASWDPRGTTNFTLNCEAGKPMLYRPARAYDWAWDMFTPDDRAKIAAVSRERVLEAWNSGEVQRGTGHLQRPYNSHGNRIWHKIAEAAIAHLDEIPEAPHWLDYAVNKFYACYPVWSDDDGGWHEGVSYWAGYQSKAVWWLQVAHSALGIDGLKKPFFSRVGDYPLYLAPPHSPNAGFADLSSRPVSAPPFLEYHLRMRGNSGTDAGNVNHWAWWAKQTKMRDNGGALGFLYRANLPPLPEPVPPEKLPSSKIFHGIGVASLHTTLLDSRDDVHFAFKSSPFGSQSHGHNPQNSFLLNAYGEALLVANGYRDLHGSKFHYQFVHSTRAQNAVLVDGQGQIPHSALSTGRIVRENLTQQFDYIAGDATVAYGKRLDRAWRHVFFVKQPTPFLVLYDELVAPSPASFQIMLHALAPFDIDAAASRLRLERKNAGLDVAFLSPVPLTITQTDGFQPPPTKEFPNHWHIEASTTDKRAKIGIATVLLPRRSGRQIKWQATRSDSADSCTIEVTVDNRHHRILFPTPGHDQAPQISLPDDRDQTTDHGSKPTPP